MEAVAKELTLKEMGELVKNATDETRKRIADEIKRRIEAVRSELFLLNMADRFTQSDWDYYYSLHDRLSALYTLNREITEKENDNG